MKGLEIDITAKTIEIVSIRTSNEISLIKTHVSTILSASRGQSASPVSGLYLSGLSFTTAQVA